MFATVVLFSPPPTVSNARGEVGERVVLSASPEVHPPPVVKPCEMFSVSVRVSLDGPASRQEWERIVRKASETMVMDGREYRNRLTGNSGTNDGAVFEFAGFIDSVVSEDYGERAAVGVVLVTFLMDAESGRCLFLREGAYNVLLTFGAVAVPVDIRVSRPTAAEERCIQFIDSIEVLAFLMDPANVRRNSAELRERIESVAQLDCVHSRMLRLGQGIGLARGPSRFEGSSEQEKAWRLEFSREVYEVLEPHCQGPVRTRLGARATLECALAAARIADLSDSESERMAFRINRDRLLESVAHPGSPITLRDRASALKAEVRKSETGSRE